VTYLRLLAHIVVRGQQGHQELLELSLIRCHLVLLVQMNQNTRVAGTTIFTSVFTRRRPPKKEQSNWLGCQRVPISRTARWVRGHREFSGAVRWSVTKQLFYGFRVVYPTFYAILEVQARWNIAEAPLTTLVAAIDNDRLLLARKRVSQPVMPETSRSNPNSYSLNPNLWIGASIHALGKHLLDQIDVLCFLVSKDRRHTRENPQRRFLQLGCGRVGALEEELQDVRPLVVAVLVDQIPSHLGNHFANLPPQLRSHLLLHGQEDLLQQLVLRLSGKLKVGDVSKNC